MTVVMKYARCQVLPGTFDSELYVIIGDVSALVDKGSVRMILPSTVLKFRGLSLCI